MLIALIFSGIYFSWVDIKTHRIPNKSLAILLLVLFAISLFSKDGIYFTSAAIFIFAGTLLSVFAGLGFGDVKLLTLLSLFVIAPTRHDFELFLFGAACTAAIALALARSRGRKSSDAIAMAPSIFAGAILCASLT
jgi:Flp pilus assembly protein protease CpaA